jgi:hypothetical protein
MIQGTIVGNNSELVAPPGGFVFKRGFNGRGKYQTPPCGEWYLDHYGRVRQSKGESLGRPGAGAFNTYLVTGVTNHHNHGISR